MNDYVASYLIHKVCMVSPLCEGSAENYLLVVKVILSCLIFSLYQVFYFQFL